MTVLGIISFDGLAGVSRKPRPLLNNPKTPRTRIQTKPPRSAKFLIFAPDKRKYVYH